MYVAPLADAHNDLVLVIATLSPDGHGEVVKWERCLYLKDLTAHLPRVLMGDLHSLHMRLLETRISTATGSIIEN